MSLKSLIFQPWPRERACERACLLVVAKIKRRRGVGEAVIKTRMLITLCVIPVIARLAMRAPDESSSFLLSFLLFP